MILLELRKPTAGVEPRKSSPTNSAPWLSRGVSLLSPVPPLGGVAALVGAEDVVALGQRDADASPISV